MIFDWDVHHGQGTQEIFWKDPNVLVVSAYLGTCFGVDASVFATSGTNSFRIENGHFMEPIALVANNVFVAMNPSVATGASLVVTRSY